MQEVKLIQKLLEILSNKFNLKGSIPKIDGNFIQYNENNSISKLRGLKGDFFYRWKSTPTNPSTIISEVDNGLFNKHGARFFSYGNPWWETRGGNALIEIPYESFGKEVIPGTNAHGTPRIGTDIRKIHQGHVYRIKTPEIIVPTEKPGVSKVVKEAEWELKPTYYEI